MLRESANVCELRRLSGVEDLKRHETMYCLVAEHRDGKILTRTNPLAESRTIATIQHDASEHPGSA